MKTTTKFSSMADVPVIMNVEDACNLLGLGRTKVYSLINSGNIRHFRVGRTIKIPKESIESYIDNHSYNNSTNFT